MAAMEDGRTEHRGKRVLSKQHHDGTTSGGKGAQKKKNFTSGTHWGPGRIHSFKTRSNGLKLQRCVYKRTEKSGARGAVRNWGKGKGATKIVGVGRGQIADVQHLGNQQRGETTQRGLPYKLTANTGGLILYR